MTIAAHSARERLIKSDERVRDLGEVFTPSATVQQMLNLLPASIWAIHPSPTFLEPACGDGNFLVAIFARKLEHIATGYAKGGLPAGTTREAAQFHALEALASIYAVDISVDNVVGGMPGNGLGSRARLLGTLAEWSNRILTRHLTSRSPVSRAAEWIVYHNIIVANMLAHDAWGKRPSRDHLHLIEYSFEPKSRSVTLIKTTLGDVAATRAATSAPMLSLLSTNRPIQFWSGKAKNLGEATRLPSPALREPTRNGMRKRQAGTARVRRNLVRLRCL
jgi:hypothetical protein